MVFQLIEFNKIRFWTRFIYYLNILFFVTFVTLEKTNVFYSNIFKCISAVFLISWFILNVLKKHYRTGILIVNENNNFSIQNMQKVVLFENNEIIQISVTIDGYKGENDRLKVILRGVFSQGIDNRIVIKSQSGKLFKFNFLIDCRESYNKGYNLFQDIATKDKRVKFKTTF